MSLLIKAMLANGRANEANRKAQDAENQNPDEVDSEQGTSSKKEKPEKTAHEQMMDNERKCFVHMLGVLIMGTDIVLDYFQIITYWKYGPDTRDLFISAAAVMAIVPAILAFYLACIFTDSKVAFLYKGICTPNEPDVLSGMFAIPGIRRVLSAPTCTPCLGLVSLSMSFAADAFMFTFLFIVFFPFMILVVTLTPIAGLFIGWKDMEASDLKRYYLVRYLNGPFEALPHLIINAVFIYRTGIASGTAVASLVFSVVSVCQVVYQAFGVGKVCCCRDTKNDVFSGAGNFIETITHTAPVRSPIVES